MPSRTLPMVLWAALLLVSFPALAQFNKYQNGWFVLRVSPQHLLLSGLHLDVEKQLKQAGTQSLLFSPRVYWGTTRFVDNFTVRQEQPEDKSRVKGFGAELQHRLYSTDLIDLYDHNFYFGYGVNFHRFGIRFRKEGWGEELGEDGLYYYRLGPDRPFKEVVNRLGAVLYLGLQERFLSDRLLVDLHLAMGYTHSSGSSSYPSLRYNRNMLDYGYTGFYLYPGVKLGVVL
ncbi:hypothetical protein [Sabulibacter ruber]|uniref:hypothetical protein n=1 Tax=Sabulibacter ruber TaxID=2811901 RepID=UPI001A95F5F7|nr:hypothetical protein [Sabulibacter ruber]